MKMRFKCKLSVLVTACILCLQITFTHSQKHPRPLIFKSWPPMRANNAMMLQLRGAGSTNIVSKQPAPHHMFIKSHNPIQLAMPARFANRPLKSSPSTHVYFKTGAPSAVASAALKKPYAGSITPSPVFKFTSPAHKTAIKFKSAPPVPLKAKPEFVFEKVTVPKFAEPILGTEAAIHQIAAPNLSLNQLDSDLTKVSVQAFALENKPHQHFHQYKVHEGSNDLFFKNAFTGQKTIFAPDNDPKYKTHAVPITDDPLNIPSNNKPKPADVLYHQNIEFNASPLVQQHFAVDPFGFPVTSQPQLQQYHLQQNAMLQQGMPLAAYNPTYLVMQSNSLLGQHQQHLTPHLFSPAHGYIDTSGITRSSQVTSPYLTNEEVASLGQIYSAQKDVYHQLQGSVTSTVAPSTISNFHHDVSASQNIPAVSHQEPNPVLSNYQHSPNFLDFSDDHLSSNDIQNFLNYEDAYQRQLENDIILKEAQEKLQDKIQLKKQQEATAYDLHQLAVAEKFNPLRIIVPDEDQQFKKRIDEKVDDENDSEEFEEYEDETTTTDKPAA